MGVVSFLRFYLDPATGEPHIYEHGVSEEEVEEALRNSGEERPGRGSSRVVIGATEAGRLLRIVYAPDSDRHTLEALLQRAVERDRRRRRERRRHEGTHPLSSGGRFTTPRIESDSP